MTIRTMILAALLVACASDPASEDLDPADDTLAGNGSGSGSGSGSGGSGSGSGEDDGVGLAEGAACTTPPDCGPAATCIYNPMRTTTTCRPSCNPDAPQCADGRHCMPLTDGWGACVPKPTSVSPWRVTAIGATITTNVNFDPFGGKPDPYAMIRQAGTSVYFRTPTADDTFTPIWNHQFAPTYQYSQLAGMAVFLLDDDDGSDADIAYFVSSLQPWWAGEITRYTIPHSFVTVTFEISPGT
jgi:hypothetical protein